MGLYNDEFYKNCHSNTIYSAKEILSIVQEYLPEINSAVDLGCGVGTFLSALEANSVRKVCGVDRSWVPHQYLEISPESFIQHNFGEIPNLGCQIKLIWSYRLRSQNTCRSPRRMILYLR